ncbi:type II toxin-antitoxin system antitoxin, RelB/DinJ family [Salmonella enterica subsp. diarizonae serovar 59:z10:-]|nr:type II toxin-antitoxin system antitoxin, RelB/DinJ family [Salmonella enterica subsp. diarizonae serovar 59:z10:-]
MAANAFVRARIDEAIKNEAADVLASMGMTVSDLMRITLTKVAREKALPFDMRVPNEMTAKTIAASEKGIDVHKAEDADDLFNKLGI